jgi:SulP family sulfate permease
MAFAIASGAKPEQGIYTSIIAGLAVSIFGGSRLQIAGPTGAFIAVLATITARHGIDGLQIATLMAGVMLIALGVARLGNIIRFIPYSVILGFTAGIGVIIWVGQWPAFLGLPTPHDEHFHLKLWHTVASLPSLDLTTTGLSVLSLIALVMGPKLPFLKRIPGPLIALVVATIIQAEYQFPTVQTIGSAFGGIPSGLPAFHLPVVTMSRLVELIGPAFAIALLGAIESLLSAVIADGMAGTQHHSNQELIGQGIANLLAPLFGGFAATGAIARTATNIRNGATSPLSGIVHSLTLVLIIVALAPLAIHIPLAVLAAILFVVAWNMSEIPHFWKILRRAPRADVIVLLVTFTLTVFADIVVAVNIGVILATLHFLKRMAGSVEVSESTAADLAPELAALNLVAAPPGVLVYTVQGPVFFAAVEALEHALRGTHTDPKVIIIRLKWVPFIDLTGLQALESAIVNLQRRQVRVILTGANARVYAKLVRNHLLNAVGPDNYFAEFQDALAACSPKTSR